MPPSVSDPARDVVVAGPSPAATMPLDIHIDEATAADAPAIAAIGAKTFTETFAYSVPSADLAAYLQATYTAPAVLRERADARKTTLVARVLEPASDMMGVVGFVQLERGKTDPNLSGQAEGHAGLQKLYIDVRVHGRGIGTRLIAAVEAIAQQEGFSQLWLTVYPDCAGAVRLYEKLGYTRVGETESVTGTCVLKDWVFVKRLASSELHQGFASFDG